jgi:hypothetical protein
MRFKGAVSVSIENSQDVKIGKMDAGESVSPAEFLTFFEED